MNIAPVLFLIFNRPQHTQVVFNRIRNVRPAKLFIAADGPRNSDDELNCKKSREIINQVDWPCEVKSLFRDNNLGVQQAVVSAIDWFFAHVEEGIILEDDCLPDRSFFSFTSEMLDNYRNDDDTMHINGTNYLKNKRVTDASYYFSNIPHPWGWATWKGRWEKYESDMNGFEDFVRENRLSFLSNDKRYINYWLDMLARTKNGTIKTWDYQWFYTIWKNHGIVISPVKNLITNIGFGPEGTFTKGSITKIGRMKSYSITDIIHPKSKHINTKADEITLKLRYREATPNVFDKIRYKLRLTYKS